MTSRIENNLKFRKEVEPHGPKARSNDAPLGTAGAAQQRRHKSWLWSRVACTTTLCRPSRGSMLKLLRHPRFSKVFCSKDAKTSQNASDHAVRRTGWSVAYICISCHDIDVLFGSIFRDILSGLEVRQIEFGTHEICCAIGTWKV